MMEFTGDTHINKCANFMIQEEGPGMWLVDQVQKI
jgi:hypothetical protein